MAVASTAPGAAEQVNYSTDGENWTRAVSAEAVFYRGIAYGDNGFVVVGDQGNFRVMYADAVPSGFVVGVDTGALTMSLEPADPDNEWGVNTGNYVINQPKVTANARLYTVHDANGNVSDLTSVDPGFVSQASNGGPFTLTFPAVLPSGNAPDDELPDGTTISTQIQAINTAGDSIKTGGPLTPARV